MAEKMGRDELVFLEDMLECFEKIEKYVVLDDTNRKDESEIVKRWVDLLEAKGFKISVTELKGFEKGMVILELG